MYNPRSFVATKFTTTEPKEILKKVSYPLPTTGKYRVYLSKGNYQDSNTWIKLYESTSRRTLGIDSVHVDEIVSGDYWIIIDYEANQSFSALTTCNSQEDTSRIDYSIGRSFYSIDQQTWTDMGEMGSGVKCEPDIYTYTDDYSFGNSTITKQDLSNYRESVYITINNENNLNVTEYKVLEILDMTVYDIMHFYDNFSDEMRTYVKIVLDEFDANKMDCKADTPFFVTFGTRYGTPHKIMKSSLSMFFSYAYEKYGYARKDNKIVVA
jgi:hypothetical protein